jgi:hypothetical protein
MAREIIYEIPFVKECIAGIQQAICEAVVTNYFDCCCGKRHKLLAKNQEWKLCKCKHAKEVVGSSCPLENIAYNILYECINTRLSYQQSGLPGTFITHVVTAKLVHSGLLNPDTAAELIRKLEQYKLQFENKEEMLKNYQPYNTSTTANLIITYMILGRNKIETMQLKDVLFHSGSYTYYTAPAQLLIFQLDDKDNVVIGVRGVKVSNVLGGYHRQFPISWKEQVDIACFCFSPEKGFAVTMEKADMNADEVAQLLEKEFKNATSNEREVVFLKPWVQLPQGCRREISGVFTA